MIELLWASKIGEVYKTKQQVSQFMIIPGPNNDKGMYGGAAAMGVASIVPVIMIFALLQRYIVEGISTTGLKG